MAIGWGKSYEEQMEEANQRASEEKWGHKPAAVRQREQALESLRLSRARIEQQLSRAVHPAHRQMLMKALQAIEKQADDLAQSSGPPSTIPAECPAGDPPVSENPKV